MGDIANIEANENKENTDCNDINLIQKNNSELVTRNLTKFFLSRLKETNNYIKELFKDQLTYEWYSKNIKSLDSEIERDENNRIIKVIYKNNEINEIIVKEIVRDENNKIQKIILRGNKLPNHRNFKRNKIIIRDENNKIIGFKYTDN